MSQFFKAIISNRIKITHEIYEKSRSERNWTKVRSKKSERERLPPISMMYRVVVSAVNCCCANGSNEARFILERCARMQSRVNYLVGDLSESRSHVRRLPGVVSPISNHHPPTSGSVCGLTVFRSLFLHTGCHCVARGSQLNIIVHRRRAVPID